YARGGRAPRRPADDDGRRSPLAWSTWGAPWLLRAHRLHRRRAHLVANSWRGAGAMDHRRRAAAGSVTDSCRPLPEAPGSGRRAQATGPDHLRLPLLAQAARAVVAVAVG